MSIPNAGCEAAGVYGRSSFKVWSSFGTVHSSKGVIGLGGFFSIGTPVFNVVYVYDRNEENMLLWDLLSDVSYNSKE
jgi:hypothetical protein